ncbi:putative nucleoside transporter YegT [Novipirellula aureliae]|uniref:Putative nucleoside transporter YegT n=1 Tax=Novipirellula aureliae TaxID=2527966 RepID=A0A5C6D7K2_9BACT|nr:MFS transporter [Novipirellula aureliae]TWU33173.1 putative nucleoside transporter YegT [Novipirellula aureliae]
MTPIKIRLSIMMFLQFFVWGAFFVPLGSYLGVIFRGSDDLNTIIGGVYSTQTWAAVFAPLIVGFIADRLFNKERINGVLQLIGAGMLWWCSTITESPVQFYWVMMAFFLCYMPTMALVNAISFQNLDSIENDFPKVRLWGTIGWIVSGLVVSQSMFGLFPIPLLPGVTDAGSSALPLKLASVVGLVYGLYSFTLPASPPQDAGKPNSIAKVLGLDAIRLFKNPSYAVFALCSFLICIPLAFYYARTYEFVSNMAFGDRSAGVMALGQVSELFFMALVPFFLRRLGVKMMLIVGMMAWAVRYAVFGLMPLNPAFLIFGIVLHGVCYDFFFVTGQLYTDRVAPKEIRTSAQALLGLLTYGAGMLVGNLIHGRWGDHIGLDPTTTEGWLAGARQFWLLPAGLAVAVSVLFLFTFWDRPDVEAMTATDNDADADAVAT